MAITLEITEDRVIFNAGKFDSDSRFLRIDPSPLAIMLIGPSLQLNWSATFNRITWRYECGDYILIGRDYDGDVSPPTSVSNTPLGIRL
jgi:hypothetical protein